MPSFTLRNRLFALLAFVAIIIPGPYARAEKSQTLSRPNILFCMADDWSWPHAGAYGDQVVQTPAFDRLAREGVLFESAFVTAPSCTPCRNAVLTGQWHWRLGEGGNLWSTLHPKHPVYPLPGGYPMRAIRTDDFLYIRNFAPDRWPGGCPDAEKAYTGHAYGDCDGSPTKTFVLEHRDDPKFSVFYRLAFAKRPAEELYDLKKDPNQLKNVAGQAEYAHVQKDLWKRLEEELAATEDPRVVGGGEAFDEYPYRHPKRKR